jgi:serine/threonine protein kinase
MRKTIARVLGAAGIEVVAQAPDGQAAVEEVRRHRPDVVVLDLNMPVLGGLDALKIMRAEDPSVRVLICSAVAEEGTIRRGITAGAVGYLTKPFEHQKLVATVEELLRPRAESVGAEGDPRAALEGAVLGPYRVGALLGEGGMAAVYEGEDPGLGRRVAIKVLRGEYARNADLVVRFLNEARAMARVTHPSVVGVYFAGSDRGRHFFAMEHLAGPDLEDLVLRDGPLEERQALGYLVQAACGLAAAAAQGLVHCDVKPSNLMAVGGGLIKVTDFGIAQAVTAAGAGADPDVMGTPCFMAPEQVLGNALDFRTDVYALGATLYFLITGEPPCDGEDPVEVALRQVHDPIPQIPGASRAVNRLLSRMMAKSPEARHAAYDELLADIRRAL